MEQINNDYQYSFTIEPTHDEQINNDYPSQTQHSFTIEPTHDDIDENTIQPTENVLLGSEYLNCGPNFPRLHSRPVITEGTCFPNFDIAIHFCTEYGRFCGFTVRKKRSEKDSNGNLRYRCLDCEFSGSGPKENNNHINKRNKGSKKTGCPWIINLSHPISHSYVRVTKFVDNHNHQLLADTVLFSTEFRLLSDNIKQDIEYYVNCGVCDLPTIRALLQPKYQDQFILSQDLSNYIQKVKRDKADKYNDSARLLENLLAQQQSDPLMLVIPRIDPISSRLSGIFWMTSRQQLLFSKYNDVILHDNTALTNRYKWPLSLFIVVDCNNKTRLLAQAFVQDETECSYVWLIQCLKKTSITPCVIITDADPAMLNAVRQELPDTFHIHCIFHIAQNLPKKLKAVLGKDYLNFINDFYKARNSITVEIFEKRWQNLVLKYSQAETYLHNTLYESKESWAYCFTLCLFTGGIQSTQRVESLNGILHKAIESSMNLSVVYEKIEKRLEQENLNERFITYKYAKTHYNQPHVVAVIFKNISTLISYWLSPNLYEEFKKQMVESVSYRARIVQFSEVLFDEQQQKFMTEQQGIQIVEQKENLESIPLIEDRYEDKKIYVQEMIKRINEDEIFQLWRISSLLSTSNSSDHYILLMTNGWHICTCLLLVNSGVICRHYFKLMMETNDAKFHISMVPRRWYKENLQFDNDNIKQSPVLTLGNNNTELSNDDSFNKIDFSTEQPSIYQEIKESGSQRQVKKKNEFAAMMGLAKTTVNLAVEVGDQLQFKKMLTEYHNELVKIKEINQSKRRLQAIENREQKEVISVNDDDKILFSSDGIVYSTDEILEPLEHIAKGRPPSKRLKSSVEVNKKGKNKENQNIDNGKGSKRGYGCRRCGDMGHNVRTCKVNQ